MAHCIRPKQRFNTPQFNWARNKMPRRPQPMPPIDEMPGKPEEFPIATAAAGKPFGDTLASMFSRHRSKC
jgi:hypothetical protein